MGRASPGDDDHGRQPADRPGTGYTSLGVLYKGTGFTHYCLAYPHGQNWAWGKVTSGPNAGKTGWVYYAYLTHRALARAGLARTEGDRPRRRSSGIRSCGGSQPQWAPSTT